MVISKIEMVTNIKDELSDVELWQKSEDERLEYEGYCNKIRKGLEDLDEKSGERALWELVQNARDMSSEARIKIELTENSIIFLHHGEPFDYTSFRALVKQDSSKDRNGADQVGQYGTGFMTTHAFNRLVYVNGPFVVKTGKDTIKGYVQVKNFELDRTLVDTADGPIKMKEQLEKVKQFWKGDLLDEISDDTTSFRYDLTPLQVDDVSTQLSSAIRLMPFVLVINSHIKEVEIYNHLTNEHFSLRKSESQLRNPLENKGWQVVTEEVLLVNHVTNKGQKCFACKSLQSDKKDIVVIPPFPDSCGVPTDIPSLFLWFPLLGTEAFGVNFIFHSKRFYPVEKRNNIMLPGSTIIKREKGKENSAILKDMTEVVFSYFAKDENAMTLTRQMCEVSFPKTDEDEITRKFYEEMQSLWNTHIPNWKILPINGDYYAITDTSVKLLHRDFYSQLKPEQKAEYEPILTTYALLPKRADGQSYLMPSTDLIAWSETIDRWDCKRDSEFFITVTDVCQAIQTKSNDLHSFLKLMKDSGNEAVMKDYALLPNRAGELRKKSELYHAVFMTSEVYELVRVVMGDDSKKLYDPAYLDVCEVNPYSQSDLQRAIASTMGIWRASALINQEKTALTDEQLTAMITFCSASYLPEFNNIRGRMMPLIAKFYGKDFRILSIIKFKEEKEEDFYSATFNLLLDYTLFLLNQKDAIWVNANKDWLKSFLIEYSPSTNEEHKKRLDDYGILPNQKGKLCLMKDLHKNNGVPSEMATIYLSIFGSDLHESWIDADFENIVSLTEDRPEDIAKTIEGSLVSDMKQEPQDRKFEKIVRTIILNIAESKDWEEWFGQINDKKATYTFSMKSGKAQKSLFSLMDIEDDNLARLAKLSETGNIESMLDKMERQQELEYGNKARFNHLHAIGKHIEDVLREKIGLDLVQVENPTRTESDTITEDVQDGQDIIIRVKKGVEWNDVFYVEVKSKWNFTEPAHMSTRQVRMAALHPDEYALCCVDLRKHKDEDLARLPAETIIVCTRVKMGIGNILNPMVKAILEADDRSDDEQIKISEYRSNMGAKIFEIGEPLEVLLDTIENKIKTLIEES
ncbi:sacsin N-terminal ATP-binding-like domain-containing protein [Alistipes shahii]